MTHEHAFVLIGLAGSMDAVKPLSLSLSPRNYAPFFCRRGHRRILISKLSPQAAQSPYAGYLQADTPAG